MTQTTQYQVSNFSGSVHCFGGKADTIGPGGGFYTANFQHGLIFDAHKSVIIKSSEFYASTSGNRTIRVLDQSNNQIAAVTVNIPAGHSVVNLGLEVPMGLGYKLVAPVTPNLYRNNTYPNNVGYPYEICGLITIKESTAGTSPASYYYFFYNIEVEEQTTLYGGLTDKTANGGYFTSSPEHGLYFNCHEEVLLKSVKVYSNQAGNRTIRLKDAAGVTISSVTVNIPNGESRIDLNMSIPAQSNLLLTGPGVPYLWRDGAPTAPDLPYPFNIGDVITITGNTANNIKYYYYFYDWEVEKTVGCESPKIPVTAYIYNFPSASFSYTADDLTVTFTNLSTGGGTYFWDFGDGNNSNEENPTHTYLSEGIYIVSLTLTNDCGQNTFTDTIDVIVNTQYYSTVDIKIFPNPVEKYLFIYSAEEIKYIEIISMYGNVIISAEINDSASVINLEKLKQAIYVLKISTEKEILYSLIVKR